jgi:hypothetical protein
MSFKRGFAFLVNRKKIGKYDVINHCLGIVWYFYLRAQGTQYIVTSLYFRA